MSERLIVLRDVSITKGDVRSEPLHPNPGARTPDNKLVTLFGFPVTVTVDMPEGYIAVTDCLRFDPERGICYIHVDTFLDLVQEHQEHETLGPPEEGLKLHKDYEPLRSFLHGITARLRRGASRGA